MFLETARLGEAQMLVTFDNDLLQRDLVERLYAESIRVLSIGDFVRELREAGILVENAIVLKQTP
jgi:predicted nucleic acid-binding protein